MTLVANSITKTTIWIPFFVTFKHTVNEFYEKLFPRVKSEIQIHDFFPAKPKNSNIREIKLPRKISYHTVNCERVCFSCSMSAFVSRFQQSRMRIRELREFSGQESYRAPKSESARTPMDIVKSVGSSNKN